MDRGPVSSFCRFFAVRNGLFAVVAMHEIGGILDGFFGREADVLVVVDVVEESCEVGLGLVRLTCFAVEVEGVGEAALDEVSIVIRSRSCSEEYLFAVVIVVVDDDEDRRLLLMVFLGIMNPSRSIWIGWYCGGGLMRAWVVMDSIDGLGERGGRIVMSNRDGVGDGDVGSGSPEGDVDLWCGRPVPSESGATEPPGCVGDSPRPILGVLAVLGGGGRVDCPLLGSTGETTAAG